MSWQMVRIAAALTAGLLVSSAPQNAARGSDRGRWCFPGTTTICADSGYRCVCRGRPGNRQYTCYDVGAPSCGPYESANEHWWSASTFFDRFRR